MVIAGGTCWDDEVGAASALCRTLQTAVGCSFRQMLLRPCRTIPDAPAARRPESRVAAFACASGETVRETADFAVAFKRLRASGSRTVI